jgi:hypothetical protein
MIVFAVVGGYNHQPVLVGVSHAIGERTDYLPDASVGNLNGAHVIAHGGSPTGTVACGIDVEQKHPHHIGIGIGEPAAGFIGDGGVAGEGELHIGVRDGGQHRRPAREGEGIEVAVGGFESREEAGIVGELVAGEAIAGIVDAMFIAPHAGEHARPAGGAMGNGMGDDAHGMATVGLQGVDIRRASDGQSTGHGAIDADDQHLVGERESRCHQAGDRGQRHGIEDISAAAHRVRMAEWRVAVTTGVIVGERGWEGWEG